MGGSSTDDRGFRNVEAPLLPPRLRSLLTQDLARYKLAEGRFIHTYHPYSGTAFYELLGRLNDVLAVRLRLKTAEASALVWTVNTVQSQ